MQRFRNGTFLAHRLTSRLLGAGIFVLACSLPLLADTPSLLRRVPAGSCYCHCAESKLHGGCVKMCDSKRYASRWRAARCAKPHMQSPARDSNAGPRFPHPGRAEHAQLRK
jgi:hypothetical protein